MIVSRTVIPISCLLVAGAVCLAQTPAAAPVPMAPYAPSVPPRAPVARPIAPMAPMQAQAPLARPVPAPRAILDQDDLDRIREMAEQARDQALFAVPQLDPADMERARQMAEDAKEQVKAAEKEMLLAQKDWEKSFKDSNGFGKGWGAGMSPDSFAFNFDWKTPMAFAQSMGISGKGRQSQSDDRMYDNGLRGLDNHRWEDALESFNQVASHAGPRADGALYWKAYALNRLGRRDEARAAIAELRKSYATSRWLDEAKALDIEVQQAAGKPVSPETESDEELKLMALNGIMQSDPDRAIPLVENILKGPGSHKLKAQALYVLSINGSPRAQQIVEQIARGNGNPDLQVKAVEYLSQRRRQTGNNQNQLLMEIYNSSSDLRVKSAILDAFRNTRDVERLAQIAKTEKNTDLRDQTFSRLGDVNGQPELWQIYQSETSPEEKIKILSAMQRNGNADKLVEVIKKETDPKVRRRAIDVLATQETGAPEKLVSIYSTEQDPQLRQAVVDALSNQRNAKYLVDLARAEKDQKLKLRIVERLSNMRGSKEAQDYLMEILK